MKSDVNGVSQCLNGKEQYEMFTSRIGGRPKKMVQYDYRTESGDFFSTIAPSLKACRDRRDLWLSNQK